MAALRTGALPPQHPLSQLQAVESAEALKSSLLARHALDLTGVTEVYLFGTQRLADKLHAQLTAAGISVLSFLDNAPSRQGGRHLDRPVLAPAEGRRDVPVVTASTIHMGPMMAQLRELGYTRIWPQPVLAIAAPTRFPAEPVFEAMLEDLVAHREAIAELYDQLADEPSRRALSRLIEFRMTLDPQHLVVDDGEPYFDPSLTALGPDEVFVDGGGYTGDTAQAFMRAVDHRYRRIHIFEPMDELMAQARTRLANQPSLVFHPEGLHRAAAELRFNATGGADGACDPEGDLVIPVVALDAAVTEPVTFLKLDVEGAEAEALHGSAGHLKATAPKLAIAAYHRPCDLWHLPALIRELNPRYRIRLRHYSRGPLETIVYATAEGQP